VAAVLYITAFRSRDSSPPRKRSYWRKISRGGDPATKSPAKGKAYPGDKEERSGSRPISLI